MNVLITGYAGFIGYHMTKRLLENKDLNEVFAIDNFNNYYDIQLKRDRVKDLKKHYNYNKLNHYKTNITKFDSLTKILSKKKIDIIIHLAAQAGIRYSLKNPRSYIDNNIIGFFNIMELARINKIKKVIYASSSSVYGNSSKAPFHEKDMNNNPLQIYAATKISNEVIAASYSNLYQIQTIGLRFFTVYGPFGRPDMAIYKFVDSIFKNKKIALYNKGEYLRDFTFVDDITQGIDSIIKLSKRIVDKNKLHEIYNIGKGSPIKIIQLVKIIEDISGKKAKIDFKSSNIGEMNKTYSSTLELRKKFNFLPKTTIEDGISKFINWYKNYNLI